MDRAARRRESNRLAQKQSQQFRAPLDNKKILTAGYWFESKPEWQGGFELVIKDPSFDSMPAIMSTTDVTDFAKMIFDTAQEWLNETKREGGTLKEALIEARAQAEHVAGFINDLRGDMRNVSEDDHFMVVVTGAMNALILTQFDEIPQNEFCGTKFMYDLGNSKITGTHLAAHEDYHKQLVW